VTAILSHPDHIITTDFFFKKKVTVYQDKKGYRFSIDAPLLADFLPSLPFETALEVGTGCGIISLLALFKKKFSMIHAVEVQQSLSRLALLNAQENCFSPQLAIETADFNNIYKRYAGIRHIFSNPPYFETHRGRCSPNPEIRDAKMETSLTLRQLLEKSFSILPKPGNLYLVLPYARFSQIINLAQSTGFSVHTLRLVFSFKDRKPERFLVQLSNSRVSSFECPPLIIFKEKGIYSEEMDRILSG